MTADRTRPRFSRRGSWDVLPSRVAARLEALRRGRAALLDLSASNPTRCGLAWPAAALAAALAPDSVPGYDPDPRGLAGARAAVAAYLAGRGAPVDPEAVVLTASTSEAYAVLLKLLCDPGDEVLVPAPTYPLHEVLAQLEGVRLARYPLRYDGTWHVDLPALRGAVTGRTRAVVTVSPSNPAGAVLSRSELADVEDLCAARGLALIGDEVFADTAPGAPSVAAVRRCLAFQLAGLSKTCGLPQLKAAWIAVAGPGAAVRDALERLEMIADAFLSISGPAQHALERLLPDRERFLAPLRARLAANEATLRGVAVPPAPFDVLRRDGGWSAVLRVGQVVDEEALCLRLLDEGVVVQPGFFYDFERSGHVVVSLLPEPDVLERGIAIVARVLREWRPTDP